MTVKDRPTTPITIRRENKKAPLGIDYSEGMVCLGTPPGPYVSPSYGWMTADFMDNVCRRCGPWSLGHLQPSIASRTARQSSRVCSVVSCGVGCRAGDASYWLHPLTKMRMCAQ
jgi:hypothetical protein